MGEDHPQIYQESGADEVGAQQPTEKAEPVGYLCDNVGPSLIVGHTMGSGLRRRSIHERHIRSRPTVSLPLLAGRTCGDKGKSEQPRTVRIYHQGGISTDHCDHGFPVQKDRMDGRRPATAR
jgi:hypothetical protein